MSEEIIKPEIKITPISNVTKQQLRRKTAFSLPDNPTARRMKPNEIKKYLYSAIVDFDDNYIEKDPSIISIIETLISEITDSFTKLDAYWDAVFKYIEDRVNNITTSFEEQLKNEITARKQAVNELTQRIADEETTRATAVDNLTKRIGVEETGRIQSYNALDKRLTVQENAGYITKEVANLVNYYKKDETYSKTEIDEIIEVLKGLGISLETVDVLPEKGENKYIYLVPATTAGDKNIYTEWVWIKGAWEYIGSTDVNLTDYYNKAEIDAKLSKYALKHFEGSMQEYEEALAAGNISDGMICIIQEGNGTITITTAVLGKAILGQMILGQGE